MSRRSWLFLLIDNKILAVGNEAKEMMGRTPENITAQRPLKDGVIADYRITEAMLRYFINKVSGGFRLVRPEVMVSIPAGVTSTERRAVIDAAVKAGAKTAYVVKEPILAAIGAGIPINSAAGNMIVDIGGGTSEVAIISLGGVVAAHSARVGGNKIDQAIADFIKKKHGLAIGERTAEEIKIAIGSAMPQTKDEYVGSARAGPHRRASKNNPRFGQRNHGSHPGRASGNHKRDQKSSSGNSAGAGGGRDRQGNDSFGRRGAAPKHSISSSRKRPACRAMSRTIRFFASPKEPESLSSIWRCIRGR